MITYVGSLTLAALVPVVYGSIGATAVSLNAALQGNLALNASLTAHPPQLPDVIAAAEEFASQLLAASVSIPPVPNVSFSLSDCVALNASLNASLSLIVTLDALLSASIGIFGFGWVGAGNAIGAAVTSELATQWPDGTPSSGTSNAMVFGAVSAVAQGQLPLLLNLPFTGGLIYAGQRIGLAALSATTAAASPQGAAGIGTQIAATASLQASLSASAPTYPTMIGAEAAFFDNLRSQVRLPDVSFAIAATAKAASGLASRFGALCQLGDALDRFDATLFCYTYSGPANAMGAAIATELASTWGDGITPTAGACTAALLGATDTLTWSTMLGFFGGI